MSMSKTMSSPSTCGGIGQGHGLQQQLKDEALPKTGFAKTVQGGCGKGNANYAQPRLRDVCLLRWLPRDNILAIVRFLPA